jgi:hypothetical protein
MRIPAEFFSTTAVVVCLAIVLTGCGADHGTAGAPVTAIVDGLTSVHPKKVCDDGEDSWYEVYITVDQTSDLADTVKLSASRAGFQFQPTQDVITYYKDRGISIPEPADATATFLLATRKGWLLSVTIAGDGVLNAYCPGTKLPTSADVPPGRTTALFWSQVPGLGK